MYRGIIRRFARQIIEVTLFLISIVEILPISWSNTRNTRTRVLLLIRGTFTLPFCVNLSWVKCVKRCLLGVETVRDFDRVEFAFASSGLYLFNYFSRQFFFLFFFSILFYGLFFRFWILFFVQWKYCKFFVCLLFFEASLSFFFFNIVYWCWLFFLCWSSEFDIFELDFRKLFF